MPPFSSQTALPLPRGWRKITRAGVLQVRIAIRLMPIGRPIPVLLRHPWRRSAQLVRLFPRSRRRAAPSPIHVLPCIQASVPGFSAASFSIRDAACVVCE